MREKEREIMRKTEREKKEREGDRNTRSEKEREINEIEIHGARNQDQQLE